MASRRVKNEIALKELRSLNMTLTAGKLNCLDCNSINIGYSLADNSYSFDISSIDIRNQILKSLENKVEAYTEEITELTRDINKLQDDLQTILATEDVSIESLLLHKTDLVSASKADNKIIEIDNKIKQLSESLKHVVSKNESQKDEKLILYNDLTTIMSYFYKQIDPLGNLLFNDLFSKRQSIFSGSEETEFYLSKLYALRSVLKHQFPIVMDYFRGGELSSTKEEKVLELFGEFENQIILTATLKKEEDGKYDNYKNINLIDYKPNISSKLLTTSHVNRFISELKKFSIII